ncbi:MAG: hypothetical protein ACR2NZ_19790 [Rubripirellula sp.]
MRQIYAILVHCILAGAIVGQEPAEPQALNWQEPFATISASKSDDALVLLLITNEDPFRAEASLKPKALPQPAVGAKQAAQGKVQLEPPNVWCVDALSQSIQRAFEFRPDLKDRLQLQSISSGIPSVLSGGTSRNLPERAILILCDGKYRLLGLSVGVPDLDELLTLIEDSENVRTLRHLSQDDPKKVVDEIAQQNMKRLSRLWRSTFEEVLLEMDGDWGDAATDDVIERRVFDGRIQRLFEALEPTYLSDVELRFGLTDITDRNRLIVLEQHTEARHPWCQSIAPFLVGADMSIRWRELVESLWGHAATTAQDDITELLAWYDTNLKSGSIILSLKPPIHRRHLPWPPLTDRTARRGMTWQEAHDLALTHAFRKIDAQQIAALIRERDLRPIDVANPSRARYLMITPGKNLINVVREKDPPGRFAGQLRRAESSLQTE